MGKRKQAAPFKTSEEKRQALSWNMVEGVMVSHTVTVVPDNDPNTSQEFDQALLALPTETKLNVSSKSNHEDTNISLPGFFSHEMALKFEENLKTCLFSVTLQSRPNFKDGEWRTKIGKFTVKLYPDEQSDSLLRNGLPSCEECWFYANEESSRSMLYFELDENSETSFSPCFTTVFFFADASIGIEALEALQMKQCQNVLTSYDSDTFTVEVVTYVSSEAVAHLHYACEFVKPKRCNFSLQDVMTEFYGISAPSYKGLAKTSKHDIEALYDSIKYQHQQRERTLLYNVQHPSLKPRLRPYQKDAVLWMLEREGFKSDIDPISGPAVACKDQLHQLYEAVHTLDGKILFYNPYTGCMVRDKPLHVAPLPGGILADEMGLGKTVEVLACMLAHPRTDVPTLEPLPVVEIIEEENDRDEEIDEDPGPEETTTPEQSAEIVTSRSSWPVAGTTSKLSDASHGDTASVNMIVEGSELSTGDSVGLMGKSDADSLVDVEMNHENNVTEDSVKDGVHSSGDRQFETVPVEDEALTGRLSVGSPSEKAVIRAPYFDHDYLQHERRENTVAIEMDIPADEKTTIASSSLCRMKSDTSGNVNIPLPSNSATEMKINVSSVGYTGIASSDSSTVSTTCSTSNVGDPTLPSGKKKRKKKRKKKSAGETQNNSEPKSTKLEKKKKKQQSNSSISEENGNVSVPNVEVNLDTHIVAVKGKQGRPRKSAGFVELVPINELEPSPNGFFNETPVGPKEYFECICGSKEAGFVEQDKVKVQCTQCGLWQHAACVNYDLQDPYRGVYLCPHCHVISSPVISGATLIVSPYSICHQWVEEIAKHIKEKSLKVFVYSGVSKLKFIQPRTLADYHIVITTYETLRKEMDFVDLPHSNSESGRRFRHPKRFMAIPSPLIAIQWWRICLDEAQMVECVTTRTAEMAFRLSAVNRWCVTGTPIQKDVQDLYGLLVFLGEDPYWVRQWWTRLLYEPLNYGVHEPLYQVMARVMWRTAKKDVIDQINLPEQTEEVKWLTFSPVEEHFYRRQFQTCMREADRNLFRRTDEQTKLASLDRRTFNSLLHPLLSLRQACCHPQAVRGAFLPLQKSTMTMEELSESLTKKATVECEEAHRQVVAALNGLAGLDIIKGECVEAVEKYREVLRSVEEHKGQIRTDDLQQLHAMHNLQEILTLKPKGISPTIRDDQLGNQCEELREKYMTKVAALVGSKQQHLRPVTHSITDIHTQFRPGRNWWIDLLQWITYVYQDEALVAKVQEQLTENVSPEITITNRFHDIRGLEFVLHSQLKQLETCHDKLTSAIQRLSTQPSKEVINLTVECCLRPSDKQLRICPFCKADVMFSEYESKLFSFVDKGVFADEEETSQAHVSTRRQGTWADSELEKAFKSIISFARGFTADRDLLSYGSTHLKLFEALKKEFKSLRALWLALREQVSSIDELDMATTRLRTRLPHEPKTDPPQLNVLEPHELFHHKLRLLSDEKVGRNDLRKKLGQLLYLKNLAKSQGELNSGSNPDPCPICQRELGQEWTVLQCGHCYCLDCIRIMVEQYSFGLRHKHLRCAMCRELTSHTDISQVSTKENKGVEGITVKGSHSTKVEAIVRCLKQIRATDQHAKALVFSTWTDMLDKVGQALWENDVTFKHLHAGHKFQRNLNEFKHEENITALLLPVHSGANGLNLIEATHVLLVEPILNSAEELQAVGRVHRIGQTKPTKVIRFLVRGTVEEKMYGMLRAANTSTNSHDTEENTLTVGDLVSLLKDKQQTGDLANNDEDSCMNWNSSSMIFPGVTAMDDTPLPSTSGEQMTVPGSSDEQIPVPSTSGERMPVSSTSDEQIPGSSTSDEQIPDEQMSNPSISSEQMSYPSISSEQMSNPSISSISSEQMSIPSISIEQIPGPSISSEQMYSMSSENMQHSNI